MVKISLKIDFFFVFSSAMMILLIRPTISFLICFKYIFLFEKWSHKHYKRI